MAQIDTVSTTQPSEAEWFRFLAETTAAAILVIGDEGRVIYANRAVEEMSGYCLEELRALEEIWQLVAPQDRALVRERGRARLAGETVPEDYAFRLLHRGGKTRWVEVSARRVEYQERVVIVATAVDITTHRRAQETLHVQVAFEQLILGISKRFLSLSADRFDDGVRDALGQLGRFTDVDRIALFRFHEAGSCFYEGYEWHADGIAPLDAEDWHFDAARYPWAMKRLLNRKMLYVPRVADLSSEAAAERKGFEAKGIRSTVAVPVVYHGALHGFLTCDVLRQEKTWSEEGLTLLTIFGEILANALVRREAEEALSREKDQAEITLASIGDGVIRTDALGIVDYINPVARQMTGWRGDEAIGRPALEVYRVVAESTRRARRDPVAICREEKRTIVLPGLHVLLARDGHEHIIRDSVAPILDREDEVIGAVLVFKDLTQVRGLERQMTYLASHDALTGLLNRPEFEIHLEAALESAREHGREHVLLILDLLQFKLVNDACGHVAGDELLRQVAHLLTTLVGADDVLARIGGDEFAVLLEDSAPAHARKVAGAIQQAFRMFRFSWAGQRFEVGVSIGLVPITAASDSVVQLLKEADAAAYLAREGGTNKIHEYVPDDVALAERHGQVEWVHRIRRALAEDRFCLYHQRIQPLTLNAGSTLHEILVRMVGKNGAHIAPAGFIPVAERFQLGPSLDRWVIRNALRAMRESDQPLGQDAVSINLSGQSLGDDDFLDYLVERIEASGVEPGRIFFEVTETAAVANLSRAVRFIGALKEMGCRFILDDFGSGLSSFAYLKNLPVDMLKIDGAFVRSIETDPIRRAMVESIHQIGHVMGLATIAEWVETEATYKLLQELGVTYAQGFWIHRPEPL